MKLHCSAPLFALLLTLCSTQISAQDTLRIAVKGIYTNGNVVLRWAPMDIASWRYSNANGYRVERKTLRSNGEVLSVAAMDSSYTVLTAAIIPLPESQWEAMADTSDMAGIAAGSIYGDSLDLLSPEGGGMLQIYNKAREVENRFGFSLFAADQDLNVAKAMALALVDTSVVANKEYVYYVKALGTATTLGGFTAVETDSASVTTAPSGLRATKGDKTASLYWNRDETVFTSFVVERAVGAGGTFSALNTSPLMFASTTGNADEQMSYTDSLSDNSTVYVYRVRGKTPFGGYSAPSDTIHVSGFPGPLAFLMSVSSVEEVNEGALTVTWNFPVNLEAQMVGFDVYRSENMDGPFVKLNTSIIAASDRSIEDGSPLPANYYMVTAMDQNGYEYKTFPFLGQPNDEIPPIQPTILSGVCNAAGTVTLTWAKNPDADILGYRVYMSTAQAGDYAQITGTWINDTIYRYQVETNTLSEEVFFGVKALDFRQNQSVMSAPFSIMRPDVIPPSEPIIRKAESSTTGVYFEWDLSSSADVISHYLDRKEVGMPEWVPVVDFDVNNIILSYTDTSASNRKNYEYRLVAIDDADLKTSSKIVRARPIDSGLRSAVQNFSGQLTASPKRITLEWDYLDNPDLIGFEVFRAIQDSNLQRSYGFLKIPPGQGAASGNSAVLNGNQWACTFHDAELDFSIKQLNTFFVIPSATATPNNAVPTPVPAQPGQGTTASTFVVTNPNNLSGQQMTKPSKIYYWVMAKYADGGYSPVAGALKVDFQ